MSKSIIIQNDVSQKTYTEMPAVCLFIDILGFSNLLEEKTATDIAAESFIFFKTCLNTLQPVGFTVEETNNLKRKIMRLSDTIVLWHYTCIDSKNTESTKELEQKALSWIIQAGKHLMVKGFLNNFALRGAVAFGNCIHDKTESAILGRPWAKAHKLEKKLNWAGICLDETATQILTESLKTTGDIVIYKTPFKNNCYENQWVIDWRNHSDLNEEFICEAFDRIPKLQEIKVDNIKKTETLKFYREKLQL